MMESVAYDLIKKEGFEEGRKEGGKEEIREGILQAMRDNLVVILEARFETVSGRILRTFTEIDHPDLPKLLLNSAVRADSLDSFQEKMRQILD